MNFCFDGLRNPSYEIQLPYGIAAAARMNAVEGATRPRKNDELGFSSRSRTL